MLNREIQFQTVISQSKISDQTQTGNQTIAEKHDDKKHLFMIRYQGERAEQVVESVRKTVKRLLPSNIKLQVSFICNKPSSHFKIKGKATYEHKHNVIYLGTCPETMTNFLEV